MVTVYDVIMTSSDIRFSGIESCENVKFQGFSSMLYRPRRVTKIAYNIYLLTLNAV